MKNRDRHRNAGSRGARLAQPEWPSTLAAVPADHAAGDTPPRPRSSRWNDAGSALLAAAIHAIASALAGLGLLTCT